MAAGKGEQSKGEGKGFAGLSSLVSNVDTIPSPDAKKENADPRPDVTPRTDRPLEQQNTQSTPLRAERRDRSPSHPSSGSSIAKWALGIAAVIWVFGLIGESNKKPSSPASTYSPSAQTQAQRSQGSNQFDQSDTSAAKPMEPQVPSRPAETIPPVGQGLVLSIAQIRYCLAEGIRLDGARAAVDNYKIAHVDRFNTMVADYNSRCGQYRYRSGVLETARSEIEDYRSTLQSEGRARLSTSGSSTSLSSPFSSSPGSFAPSSRSPPIPATAPKNSAITDGERVLALMEKQSGVWTAARYRKAYAAFKAAEHADLARQQFWKSKADYALEMADRLGVTSSSTDNSKPSSTESLSFTGTPIYQQRDDAVSVKPETSPLSAEERQSIESVCFSDKMNNGPAAYNRCVQNQLASLGSGNRRPDLSHLSSEERQSIESVCFSDKMNNGPAAYNRCVQNQLASLASGNRRPDLSHLSSEERQSVESVCFSDKMSNGPAAYNSCLSRHLSQTQN